MNRSLPPATDTTGQTVGHSTTCYHCGLPAPDQPELIYSLKGIARNFCCHGCMAVAMAISSGGLEAYYRLREQLAPTASTDTNTDYAIYDQAAFQQDFVVTSGTDSRALLAIDGISCAACTWLIEQRIKQLPGVQQCQVNLARHRAVIEWDTERSKLSDILRAIAAIGYQPAPWQASDEDARREREQRDYLQRLGVAGIGMMQVGMYAIALHAGSLQGISDLLRDFIRYSSMLVATGVVFYAARPFFNGAWRSLSNRSLSMNVPVSVAIGFAYLASCWSTVTGKGEVYYDSVAMFTFFLLLSRYLEMRARHQLNRDAAMLSQPQVDYAWRKSPAGNFERVPPAELQVGELMLVKPGERIAADATIIEGSSDVNEAIISGESLPVSKSAGDTIHVGAINGDGSLLARVAAVGKDSSLSAIDQLLEQAQHNKPRAAQLADQLSPYFSSTVLLVAVSVYVFWSIHNPAQAFPVTLSVLVVSCPCALSLATPTALTAALSALRQQGILLRNSQVLESLTQVSTALFDKTGTLTAGQFSLLDTRCSGSIDAARAMAIATALEAHSSHPIARAFNAPSMPAGVAPVQATQLEMHPGRGIAGTVENVRYRIGTREFAAEPGTVDTLPMASNTSHQQAIYLGSAEGLLAEFILHDELRPGVFEALQALREQGIHTRLLTGDSSTSADAIAEQLGFQQHWQKSLLPADKLAELRLLQRRGERVLALGDGINDVPLLAAADVSIAVANATELSRANADCVLLGKDLRALSVLWQTSHRTTRTIRQNLAWAIGYNLAALPLSAAGLVPPWLAAIGMSASSLVVVLNALRLGRVKPLA